MVRLSLLALVYGRSEDLPQRLPGWTALVAQAYAAPNGADDLGVVYHYLQRVADQEAWSAAVGMLHSALGALRAEELMTTWFEEHYPHRVEQWRQEAWSKGKAQGQAEALLRILAARGIHVDDQSRQRILSCEDLATLDRWFDQALRATSLMEVLSSSSY